MVENSLNIHGDEILYVGDHIYTDVSQSKVHLRWRTALICRELEDEASTISSCFAYIFLAKKPLKRNFLFTYEKITHLVLRKNDMIPFDWNPRCKWLSVVFYVEL